MVGTRNLLGSLGFLGYHQFHVNFRIMLYILFTFICFPEKCFDAVFKASTFFYFFFIAYIAWDFLPLLTDFLLWLGCGLGSSLRLLLYFNLVWNFEGDVLIFLWNTGMINEFGWRLNKTPCMIDGDNELWTDLHVD